MGLFYLIGIIILIVWLARRGSDVPVQPSVDAQLEARNYEWAQFIANYYHKVSSRSEKALVERMLSDIAAQGLPVPTVGGAENASTQAVQTQTADATVPQDAGVAYQQPAPALTPMASVPTQRSQLDNTSLLLYFGAFLFVASAGLFVAFGGMSGGVRTTIVALMAAVLYVGGLWLFRHRSKLEQAALTFVGIGMAIAPLTGLAAYTYLFNQTYGSIVWFATSIVCVVLYAHALITLRKPLLGYVLIFTVLSLFESSVSVVSAPLYYYGWALALTGMGASLLHRWSSRFPELKEPADQSATVFIPLAVLTSLVVVGSQGAGQLAVSLCVAATYYFLQARQSKGDTRRLYAVASQISGVVAVAAAGYAVRQQWTDAALAVTFCNALQLAFIAHRRVVGQLWTDFGSIVLAGQFITIPVSVAHHAILFLVLSSFVVYAALVWLLQRRIDAYVVAALSWVSLPVVYGLVVSETDLSAFTMTLLLVVSVGCLAVLHISGIGRKTTKDWDQAARETYLLSVLAPLVMSFWASPWVCLAIAVAGAVSMLVLGARDKDQPWAIVVGVYAAAPLLYVFGGVDNHAAWLAAILGALAVNILTSVWYRQESSRWLSAGLWLLVPLGIGTGAFGLEWTFVWYAWAYVFVMFVLIASRAIARGVIFASTSIPLASYARTASMSYVVGYWFAASTAVWLAVFAEDGRWHATAIVSIIAVTVYVLSEYVEKWPDLLVLLPLFAQGIWLLALQPADTASDMVVFLAGSSLLALFAYAIGTGLRLPAEKRSVILDGALIAVFAAPISRLFTAETYWPMPLSLLVAAVLVYYHMRKMASDYKELAGGLITAGIFWTMAFYGVEAVQAYVHVLIAQGALYAYRRYRLGDKERSDQYIMITLAVATIPLALQALSGASGGLYGWWLLLEQVAIMLLGMFIGRRFVTMWGLYVALGAVLYQLRNLGWAALTVLAIFLIGLAVYKLQKNTDKNERPN